MKIVDSDELPNKVKLEIMCEYCKDRYCEILNDSEVKQLCLDGPCPMCGQKLSGLE